MADNFDPETGEVIEVIPHHPGVQTEQPTDNGLVLTESQNIAIDQVCQWYKSLQYDDEGKLIQTDPPQQQVFRLFGYAGTGKTTITRKAIQALGLDMNFGSMEVKFAAFTGKAAHVMRKHGIPASTIAHLIYSVSEATEEQVEEARRKLDELKARASELTGIEKIGVDIHIAAAELELKDMKKPRFGLNVDSEVKDCNLVVLDEVSMVGDEMAAHILSFQKPVLVLGDPGQLPPIRGEGAFTQVEPDIMLTDIHRQAAESPIIYLATLARMGHAINYGNYSPLVAKVHRHQIGPDMMLMADQVICGKNQTRLDLNARLRAQAGFDPNYPIPYHEKEKIICLKNDGSRGLINGMFITLHEIEAIPLMVGGSPDPTKFKAKVKDDEGRWLGELTKKGKPKHLQVYSGHFLDHLQFDKDRNDSDWKVKKGLIECTFGWAITCHKSQGSQWEKIMVYDDHLGRGVAERAKWLYTALTRAESHLIIID